MRVLVVDDNEAIRRSVGGLILKNGLDVSSVANGEQAIESMTKDPSDIVILDIEMPVTNGWEALRIMKDDDGWPETEVIMLSVYRQPEMALKAWSLGASFYVPKPYSPDSLMEVVHTCSRKIEKLRG